MRTRRSPRNQDRLYRMLTVPEETPTSIVTQCCFNCVSYGGSKRNRAICTLTGTKVYGNTMDRECFLYIP